MRIFYFLFIAASVFSANAFSQTTYTVNSTDDGNDGACDGTHCSLREAINAANTSASANDIIVFSAAATGTITLFPISVSPLWEDTAEYCAVSPRVLGGDTARTKL